jgi:hypothetical protein
MFASQQASNRELATVVIVHPPWQLAILTLRCRIKANARWTRWAGELEAYGVGRSKLVKYRLVDARYPEIVAPCESVTRLGHSASLAPAPNSRGSAR